MKTVRKLIFCALLAALTCVATMLIRVPLALNGYLNLGDALVLLSGALLPMPYAFCAAGVGSALADLFSGYVIYAPFTLLIKGAMALVLRAVYLLYQRKGRRFGFFVGALLAEPLMIGGYLVLEGILYGFIPALASVPFNALQSVVGIFVGCLLERLLKKQSIERPLL